MFRLSQEKPADFMTTSQPSLTDSHTEALTGEDVLTFQGELSENDLKCYAGESAGVWALHPSEAWTTKTHGLWHNQRSWEELPTRRPTNPTTMDRDIAGK
jgi:hypothetical protein